jgi:hypothetical protein
MKKKGEEEKRDGKKDKEKKKQKKERSFNEDIMSLPPGFLRPLPQQGFRAVIDSRCSPTSTSLARL